MFSSQSFDFIGKIKDFFNFFNALSDKKFFLSQNLEYGSFLLSFTPCASSLPATALDVRLHYYIYYISVCQGLFEKFFGILSIFFVFGFWTGMANGFFRNHRFFCALRIKRLSALGAQNYVLLLGVRFFAGLCSCAPPETEFLDFQSRCSRHISCLVTAKVQNLTVFRKLFQKLYRPRKVFFIQMYERIIHQ